MKPTKDDFDFLKLHFRGDNDYSFVKSPSIRHLLFNDIKLDDIDKNDPYYPLLNYDKRKIMYELIELLQLKTIDDDDYDVITENILRILKDDNYIYTDNEKNKTFKHETILDYFVSP
jgi:hypothetical protein